MRNLYEPAINRFRDMSQAVVSYYGGTGDETCGSFLIESPIDRGAIRVIASSDLDWEHVSASRANRPPNWREMEYVKHLFFNADETTMQLHVPQADHINNHSNCLHMWRPKKVEIPRPPSILVGTK